MRYPASEKLEIIRIVEQSHLPAKRTLDQLGIARRTFYRWYDSYLEGGPEALEDRPSAPSRVWNRIAPEVQDQIVEILVGEDNAALHLIINDGFALLRGLQADHRLEALSPCRLTISLRTLSPAPVITRGTLFGARQFAQP